MSLRRWATSRATSSSSSTMDIFPSSVPLVSPTGWATRPKELLAKNFGVPASTSIASRKTGFISLRAKFRRPLARPPCRAGDTATHPQIQSSFPEAVRNIQGGCRVACGWFSVPHFHDHDGCRPRDGGRRLVASECRRVAIRAQRRFQRDPFRFEGTLARGEIQQRRCRPTYRRASVTRLKTSELRRHVSSSSLTTATIRPSTCRSGLPGIRSMFSPPTLGRMPRSLRRFPRQDVFMTKIARLRAGLDRVRVSGRPVRVTLGRHLRRVFSKRVPSDFSCTVSRLSRLSQMYCTNIHTRCIFMRCRNCRAMPPSGTWWRARRWPARTSCGAVVPAGTSGNAGDAVARHARVAAGQDGRWLQVAAGRGGRRVSSVDRAPDSRVCV